MKKWIAGLLCGVLLLSMTACDTKKPTKKKEEGIEIFNHSLGKSPIVEDVPTEEVADIKEPNMVDSDYVTITAESLVKRDDRITLVTTYTNKTDKDLAVTNGSNAINGMMCELLECDGFFEITVIPAGETVTKRVVVKTEELAKYAIGTIKTIENVFEVRDGIDTTCEILEEHHVKLEVNTEKEYTQAVDLEGTTIYNANQVQIISKNITKTADELYSFEIDMRMVNERSRSTRVFIENVYINDVKVFRNSAAYDLLPHTVSYKPLCITYTKLQMLEITELSQIESLQVVIEIHDLQTDEVIQELTEKVTIPIVTA